MIRLFLLALLSSTWARAQVAPANITLPVFNIRTCELPNVQKKNLYADPFRGTTVFAVLIDKEGEVKESQVLVGSGLYSLDRFATTALKLCKPAVPGRDNGQPAPFWIRVSYHWEDAGLKSESAPVPLGKYPPKSESVQALKVRLLEAARNGNLEAGIQLAALLDGDKRLTLLRVLANQNHPMAQFDLSEMLEQRGSAAERAEAAIWLQRAADAGISLARQRLHYKLPAGAIGPGSEQNVTVILERHLW